MKTQKALEASLALVRNRKSGGNAHPSMLATRTISASRLVKATARTLAKEILADDQTVDPDGIHWGENGNALAAMNLAEVVCQEPTLKVPIPGTNWMLTGHCDGLALHKEDGEEWPWPNLIEANQDTDAWAATIYENKAPLFDYDDADIEKAYRQGLLYLGMLLNGPMVLAPAAWLQDRAEDPLLPWHLPARREAGQVIVCLTPYDSPKREIAFPVDQATCDAHLERMFEKARAVIIGVLCDDDEAAAKQWDDVEKKGLGEFDLTDPVPTISDADLLDAVRAERELAEKKRQAEAAHDAATEVLERYLKAKGLQEASIPCDGGSAYRVVLQPSKGGIRHFRVAASVSLRVYGGPKKPKAEAALITA